MTGKRYYLDTCIWRDYFEDRTDKFRPLGDWAFRLITDIVQWEDTILISNIVKKELRKDYDLKKIDSMISICPAHIVREIIISEKQIRIAIDISRKARIPLNDAMHAILARDNSAILVTRDKHFGLFDFEVNIKKPEELI